ncbi:ICP0-binding domain of ubiquitin-specific protease 7-domain-containing protein [Gigaspora rosea]|uniref:ubiquitinyl hydrolase 1 n=1 Tax=Gigaspora rosea TaxID=44941 RepID=A0A397UJF0_9GLOM|nr:ICP0-binding domain of ubiquitin-specific protease 7-domain-containing protein [Gigaspora rosea]
MPNLGYEIEDFQYHTWRVTDWSSLKNRITGPEFEVGGWRWRILLFPFGNHNSATVSIYLDFADLKNASADWYSCVQFALVLWNSKDPTFYISHHAHHRFTAEEPDWGYTRFYDQSKLFVPSNNYTHPLIENDACNITAFVRIIKDQTGVLWHNFLNYNSRKMTGYINLNKRGATDYINVELQLLYSIKYFRKAIYQISTEDDDPVKSIPLAMQRIFYQLQISDTPVETTELTKSFGWHLSDCNIRHDVQEFDRSLLDYLKNKMKNINSADDTISRLFVGKMKSYIRCVNVNYENTRIEDYYDISLEVKGCQTLSDSFMNYIREESCEGNNKYQTGKYGLQDAKKRLSFESFPSVLRIQLKQFEYDMQKNTVVKTIKDRLEYPMEIDLQRYLSPDSDRSKPHNYLLHGVIVYRDELHESSYHVFLKPERDGKWFKFDDNRVVPITDKEVLGEGVETPKVIDFTYMLIYIRESDIDLVLSPILAEDIPKHLQRRLDEEKALYEQKNKEAKECHLYRSIKVVTPAIFECYQGFDIVNFDNRQYPLSNVPLFKVLKNETYEAFKTMVAHKFEIPAEQIRFWIFINRQNKTIRPYVPITDDYLGMTMDQIHQKIVPKHNDLKLFLEVAKPINCEIWFPPTENSSHILVFIKYFNPDTQSLEGLGHLYVKEYGKVSDVVPILCEKKEFPSYTPLKIYEEVKPNMIEEMKPNLTFQESEIQDGDIICFQKVNFARLRIQEYTAAGRIHDLPIFYKSFFMRIIIQFKPKYTTVDLEQKPEFELVLKKQYTYDDIAKHVAAHLNADPLKLRFTTAHPTSGTHNIIIKRTTTKTLSEIIQTTYVYNLVRLLYYEMLDISIVELENTKLFKVYWLGTTVKKEAAIDIHISKTAKVNEFFKKIERKLALKPTCRIRLYSVLDCIIQEEYDINDTIDKIQEKMTLYAEEIPQDEIKLDVNDRVIQVYHFTKEPLRVHGVPFKFVIKAGELFSTTKLRLKLRLGMKKKDFSKVKFAIVQALSYSKSKYIKNNELLGLDHVAK